MKTRVRRNATVKMARIMKAATTVEYYCKENDYKGGLFKELTEKDINWMVDDLEGGHANMFELEDGSHSVHYVGRMKVVFTK